MLDAYTKVTNTCVVVPAGNEAVSRTHFSGYAGVVPGEQDYGDKCREKRKRLYNRNMG